MPPFTVASLATMTQSRPQTRPTPVIDPAAGTSSAIQPVRGELREFEERRARIDQRRDPIARQQFAAREVALARLRAAALARSCATCARRSATRRLHGGSVEGEVLTLRRDGGVEKGHWFRS